MTQHANNVVVTLSDADFTVSDPNQDIRGRKVIDEHDDEIGHVGDLFIDQNDKTLRMLQVAAGGFLGLGERHFLIPIEAVSSVTQDEVRISQIRGHVVNSPAYDPNLQEVRSREFWEPYYRYYDYAPLIWWPQLPAALKDTWHNVLDGEHDKHFALE
jgi:sporulation protein YlmC with PRC-barrel domain